VLRIQALTSTCNVHVLEIAPSLPNMSALGSAFNAIHVVSIVQTASTPVLYACYYKLQNTDLVLIETCPYAFCFDDAVHVKADDAFLFANVPNFTAHGRPYCLIADGSGSDRACCPLLGFSQYAQESSSNNSCSA
jgi:hypothetical protein